MRRFSRRRWLAAAALGAGGAALWWQHRESAQGPSESTEAPPPSYPPERIPGIAGLMEVVDASHPISVTARATEHELAPGQKVPLLVYAVEQAGRTYLNPVLRVRRGAMMHAKFWNQLDETSIVHWHGLRVDANNDGNPHYAVQPGELYEYHIPLRNRAATCWYHPHPHGRTAAQVYRGLASFLIVDDDESDALSRALDLRLGQTDIPLLLQDRRLDAQGRFVRTLAFPDLFLGYLGAEPMVNYSRGATLEAAPRIYRLRLLNGSGARIMRLAFMLDDRAYPFKVIGSDGGLLERAIIAEESFLAPGERLDVLLDLRGLAPDTTLTLRSLGFDAMNAGLAQLCVSAPARAPAPMPGHVAHVASPQPPDAAAAEMQKPLADGEPFDLLSIKLIEGPAYQREVPTQLAKVPEIDSRKAKRRTFDLDHQKMQWRINGVRFDMLGTQLSVERGSIEVWEFRNPPGGMPHPVHFHGFPFRVLERKGSPEQVRRLALDQHGLSAAESGWKDTVLVWPGERVRVALDFSHDYPGEQVYMLHCHNLEHEDQGMMLNVRVVPPGSGRA